ncbi:MAG: UPF0175 family protein [Candidatus Sumerlaeota bacterium]|nr:UPF0175 family protein [Candidatus Sumerlaeota bacterium]
MTETMIEVHIPPHLLELGINSSDVQHRTIEWLVLSLFVEGRVSSGKAARFLNIQRAEFLDLLRSRGIAYITPPTFLTSPERAQENSPGQRPGTSRQLFSQALKGRKKPAQGNALGHAANLSHKP